MRENEEQVLLLPDDRKEDRQAGHADGQNTAAQAAQDSAGSVPSDRIQCSGVSEQMKSHRLKRWLVIRRANNKSP